MSASDRWMALHVGDYLGDTMHLMGPEHGAYLLLIMHYWRHGPLPLDDAILAKIARTEPAQWAGFGAVIRAFFTQADGKLHHKRIDAELAIVAARTEQRRNAANARWMREQCGSNATAYAPAMREHVPLPSKKKIKKEALEEGSTAVAGLARTMAAGLRAKRQPYTPSRAFQLAALTETAVERHEPVAPVRTPEEQLAELLGQRRAA